MELLYYLTFGPGMHDVALLLTRVVMGVFFVSYRFRWVWDPSQPPGQRFCSTFRRNKLIGRMCSCGYGGNPWLAGTVAVVEILAGLGLIVGLLSIPSAFGLFLVMVFANCCTPKEEIPAMNPVDKWDYVSCYLRLVEPLYLTMAVIIVLCGPGRYSLDYLIWHWMVTP